jgi:hypothetical protein
MRTWADWVLVALLLPPLFVGWIMLIGLVLEGFSAHQEALDVCRKRAETPHEYRRC